MDAKQWAVRMPGGPLRIVRSDKPLSEGQVKEIYLKNIRFKASDIQKDPDLKWPVLVPVSDDDIQKTGIGWVLKESRRQRHRGLIEIIKGELVDHRKPPEVKKKVTERVESTGLTAAKKE